MKLIWSKNVYYGDTTLKDGLKGIKKYFPASYRQDLYFITRPSNEKNLLDIYAIDEMQKDCFKDREFYVLGLARGYDEAVETAGRLVSETFHHTGGFSIEEYLDTKETQRGKH